MFGIHHFLWIGISCLFCVMGILYIKKKQPSFEKVFSAACVACAVSEIVKILSKMQVVPSSDGSMSYLYLAVDNLPLHLCSIQVVFILWARFTRSAKVREALLAFMYPTSILGALLAIAMPTLLADIQPNQIFTEPRVYQYFLFHSMLIILGVYIAISGQLRFSTKHLMTCFKILGILGFATFYYNSLLATPVYENAQLVSVEFMPNFFYTQAPPIDIALTEKWHWFVWWGIIIVIAVFLVSLLYIPLILREKKRR